MSNEATAAKLDREIPEHHPYKKKKGKNNYNKNPYCLYYFHIQKDAQGEWEAKHYYYSDDGAIDYNYDLKRIARMLGRNARREHGAPPQHGCNFEDVWFTRKSYLMFLIDDDDAELEKDNAINVWWSDPDHPEIKKENHSFFDAKDFVVDLSEREDGSDERPVVVCLNHLKKNKDGDDLDNEPQTFYFKLPGLTREFFDRYPHSGGTNQGPGVPPPE